MAQNILCRLGARNRNPQAYARDRDLLLAEVDFGRDSFAAPHFS
jgi:hypothetical protein